MSLRSTLVPPGLDFWNTGVSLRAFSQFSYPISRPWWLKALIPLGGPLSLHVQISGVDSWKSGEMGRMLSEHSFCILFMAQCPEYLIDFCWISCPPTTLSRWVLCTGEATCPRKNLSSFHKSHIPAFDTQLPNIWWRHMGKCWRLSADSLCAGHLCNSNIACQPTCWC